jgi:hypothetical protein
MATLNINGNLLVKTAANWAADETVYSEKKMLITSDAFYGSTDQPKFKLGNGVDTWSNLDYMPIGEGGVSSVSGTSPIAVVNGTTTPTVSIAQADPITDGYMSSIDWNVFNEKQEQLTLTTTGTSGAATLIGAALNIPQYSGGGGGAVDSVNGETGVVVLTTGDITEDTDANYVTDAQLVVIGDTSGTNTGDQDISGISTNASAITTLDGEVVKKDYFTPAFSLLVQQSGTGSPESLQVATDTIVGRVSGGGSEIDDLSPSQVRSLINVEDGADVTDTANVTAAGALMDSEVTNLAQVKAFDSTDYATAAQGTTADSALQDVVDDTTPQLGGDLDAQSNDITSIGGITANQYIGVSQTLTDGATVNWDLSGGNAATVTLGGNRTFAAPTNLEVGTYILTVIQDGTGSRNITWNAVFKWTGGTAPTLSTDASAKDLIAFHCDGTNLYSGTNILNDVQ